MPSSFCVYIDESGDEGFTFLEDRRASSEWFVLSAIVLRKEKDHLVIQNMRDIRKLLGRDDRKPLHFVSLSHPQRVAWVQKCKELPMRTVSVLVHKKSLPEPEKYTRNPYMLYRYASRLLMERVSWLCRDYFNPKSGDGTAEITFSNRRRMSYDEIREYWTKLKNSPESSDVRIEWAHIDPAKIASVNHDQLAGLQIADCVASAHWQAVTLNQYSNHEPRYVKELDPLIYRFKTVSQGYGLKFWPSLKVLRPSCPHLEDFDGL